MAEGAGPPAPSGGDGRRIRQWSPAVVALAASLLVVGPVAAVLAFAEAEEIEEVGQPTIAEPRTDDAELPDRNVDSVSARADIDLGASGPQRDTPPESVAAVTADGQLVIVSTIDGEVLFELASDSDLHPGIGGNWPSGIDGVTISPDRSTVWYSVCCEPAAGSMYEVPIHGDGDAVWRGNSVGPRFSSSARWVISTGFVVRLDDTRDGSVRYWQPPGAAGAARAALSPDGRHIAALEWPSGDDPGQRLMLVSTQNVVESRNAASQIIDPDPVVVPGDRWRLPAFRRDGGLVVAQRPDTGQRWQTHVIDTSTLAVSPLDHVRYHGVPLDQSYDASGEWLLVLVGESEDSETGSLEWFGPNGTAGTIAGEFRTASW